MSLFNGQKPRNPRGAIIPKPGGKSHEAEPPSRIVMEYENGRDDGARGVEMKNHNRFIGTPLLWLAYRNGYNAGLFQRKCGKVAK